MTVCGLRSPDDPDARCVGELGHRGRHKFRTTTLKEEVPAMEMARTPDGEDVAIVETEHVKGEDPLPHRVTADADIVPPKGKGDEPVSWTPDSEDFINLKGKAYLPARRRIQWMRGLPDPHPDWTIDTEIVRHEVGKLTKPGPVGVGRVESGYAVVRANVFDAEGRLIATGLKSEYSENFTDYLEKAETGAIARALAVAGYGTESALDLDEGVEEGRIADAPVARPAPVRLGASAVEGVSRGGKTQAASVAQIRRVADLSRQLSLGPLGLSSVIDNLFDVPIGDLPSDETESNRAIAGYLANQSGSDVGKLISALEAALPKAEVALT